MDNRQAAGGVFDVLLKPLLRAFNPPPRPLPVDDEKLYRPHDSAYAQAQAAAKRARRRERNKRLAHG